MNFLFHCTRSAMGDGGSVIVQFPDCDNSGVKSCERSFGFDMNTRSGRRICHLSRTLLIAIVLAGLGRGSAQPSPTFQDGVTTPPVLTHAVQAEYTQEARRAGFQGFCIVHLTVDEYGIPQNVRVLRRVGMGLDENAIKAVKEERFKPAMRGGRSVAFPLSVQLNFKPTT